MNLAEFESILSTMSPRSIAFRLVKRELQKRGHWKNKNRGMNISARHLTPLSIHLKNIQQVKAVSESAHVYNPDEFTDGI